MWDREIAWLAGRQHGVVSLEQLLRLGLSESTVSERVTAGRLFRVHVGVFSVGHRPITREARFMAAVLACGPGAVLSHRSAALLRGIRTREGKDEPIHVIAPNRRGRSPAGIVAHRDGTLRPVDRTRWQGIPCTTVERTLVDLAGTEPMAGIRELVGQAEQLRVLNRNRLRALVRHCRGRRGVARLRLVLDEVRSSAKRTRGELERLFLRMCDRAGIPEPVVNLKLEIDDGRLLEVDFTWSTTRFAVEADSRRFHDTDSAYRRDRKRDQDLQLAGWRVARCTWEEVEDEPRALGRRLHRLLEPADGTI
jgi:predicted transcriptional regulator of viral defense system